MSEVRPVDANALWELMRAYDDYQGAKEAHDVELIHRDSILFAIETAPTLDAVPVEWIKAKIESLESLNNELSANAARVLNETLYDYYFCKDVERRSE